MGQVKAVWESFIASCDAIGRTCTPNRYVVSPYVELALVAALFMSAVLLFIRYTGFYHRLRDARRAVLAALYEILLYRRSPRAVLRAELRLLWRNGKALFYLAPSILLGGVLFAAMYNTLSDRFSYRPIEVGQDVVVRAQATKRGLSKGGLISDPSELEVSAQVKAPAIKTIWMRLKAKRAGILTAKVGEGGDGLFTLNVASMNRPVLPRQCVGGIDFTIHYPRREGWAPAHGWLICFLVMCAVVSIPLTRWLRISL
jgi:hypothetical protein